MNFLISAVVYIFFGVITTPMNLKEYRMDNHWVAWCLNIILWPILFFYMVIKEIKTV